METDKDFVEIEDSKASSFKKTVIRFIVTRRYYMGLLLLVVVIESLFYASSVFVFGLPTTLRAFIMLASILWYIGAWEKREEVVAEKGEECDAMTDKIKNETPASATNQHDGNEKPGVVLALWCSVRRLTFTVKDFVEIKDSGARSKRPVIRFIATRWYMVFLLVAVLEVLDVVFVRVFGVPSILIFFGIAAFVWWYFRACNEVIAEIRVRDTALGPPPEPHEAPAPPNRCWPGPLKQPTSDGCS